METAETAKKSRRPPRRAPPSRSLFNEEKKPRPRYLSGKTYRVQTPLGATYVTVNENGEGKGQPFEVFLMTSKVGSETAAVSEAIGRLISYILRLSSTVSPRNRVKEVVRQLSGIGGGRPIGFGQQRVLSLPDGISQALQEYLDESEEGAPVEPPVISEGPARAADHPRSADLCPECGAGDAGQRGWLSQVL